MWQGGHGFSMGSLIPPPYKTTKCQHPHISSSLNEITDIMCNWYKTNVYTILKFPYTFVFFLASSSHKYSCVISKIHEDLQSKPSRARCLPSQPKEN